MKCPILPVLALLVLPVASLTAQSTPQEMARIYFDAFKQGDMTQVADNMHEEELAKFRASMLPIIERNLDAEQMVMTRDAAAIRQFAGEDSIETLRDESPRDFFLRFMNWMTRMNPMMLKMMAGATMEPLGFVEEKDMAHVVCRVNVDVMGATVSQMNVMSVRKQGDTWKLMLTGEIEGLAKAMQMGAERR